MSWTQQALSDLRKAGFRGGGAQRAIVEALGAHDCCISAQELHDELHLSGRGVGIASVYRVLDSLVELRLVQRLDLGPGGARYEPITERDHHHHLVCDDCGKVEPFADNRLEKAIHTLERETPYRVATHDVVLRGSCVECSG